MRMLFLQLDPWIVCSLTPCFFATAATGPRSASRRTATIYSSVNLPLRMPASDS